MSRLGHALRRVRKGIEYVGGQSGKRAGTASATTITFSLSGGASSVPKEGDLVVIAAVVGSQARNPAQAISGYTALGQLNNTTTTYDVSLDVSYKRMGSTPDTTFSLPSTGDVADGQCYTVQVFRGVDATTPMDVTATNAKAGGTDRPNPPSITPSTVGACVVICGGAGVQTSVALTAPASFGTNFLANSVVDTNDAAIGSGYMLGWSAGAVDPGVYGGGGGNATASWAAYTLALRPAF